MTALRRGQPDRVPMPLRMWKFLMKHYPHVEDRLERNLLAQEEFGIDISAHEAKTFDDLEDTSFDVIVSLSPEAHHSALELTRYSDCEVVFWNTFDPAIISGNREERIRAYREVRDQLQARIRERFPAETSAGL